MGCGKEGSQHYGRNLYVSGWGAGGLGGKPAYGTAVGILTSPDGVREGSGEASLRIRVQIRGELCRWFR